MAERRMPSSPRRRSNADVAAVIFDLDNCLAAADEAGEALFAPAFDAIRAANRGHLTEAKLSAAFADMWRHALDHVARQHRFTDGMLRAGWDAFRTLEVRQPLHGYGDLPELARLPAARFLVTTGFRRLQESKVAALGIAPLFVEVQIDAIDEAPRRVKQERFADIASRHGWQPAQVLVVGDNGESEIAAGNALGMPTVQTLRPGVPPAVNAQWRIRNLAELSKLIPKIHSTPSQ
ncbi:MAG TPA: HAD family hydrolase [Burkholderiales bacterium]|nr:HAD family hydrolase [Burkholderiales bacterium]